MARKAASVEESFQIIETMIARLESGEQGLDEALADYEEGLRHIRNAKSQLDKYSARIEVLDQELMGCDQDDDDGDLFA